MIKRFAAIYIGSGKCEMVVGQRGKGTINVLDRAMYPIDFGSQSFTKGRISFESVYALCRIINEYIKIAKASDVEEVEIVGTAALREASNRLYLLEQIRIYTGGYRVHLLEKEDEIELIYRYMMLKCEDLFDEEALNQEWMLTSISSGNIAAAVVNGGLIDYHEMVEMGYLKMKRILNVIEERSVNFESLLTDFIDINFESIAENVKKRKIKHLVVTSHDVDLLAHLCSVERSEEYYRISKKSFVALYKSVENMTPSQLLRKYPALGKHEAETIRHTLALYLKLLEATGIEEIILIQLNICDAVMNFKFNITKNQRLMEWIEQSSYSSAKVVGKKYLVDSIHADAVEKFSLKIFDALKKRYQMEKRERFLLQICAQLLDVGHFIGHYKNIPQSKVVVENTDIIGLGVSDKRVIGSVADSVRTVPFDENYLDQNLTVNELLTVSRLTAILKLATALDKSHRKKIGKIQCHLSEKEFVINAVTTKNTQLEEYFFELSSLAMRKVYGIRPVLKIKREKI
ncbi:MAG: exopolyphosphatase [Eubacterium sp.]